MYECENCGGELRFDIPTQRLVCAHCSGTFDPAAYQKQLFADASEFEVNQFMCANCGGEITAANLSALEYCPFCGRANLPVTDRRTQKVPDTIIPFKITKEGAKEAFKKAVGRSFYAPAKLRDESFLDGFRGLFLPFWAYDVTFSKTPHLRKEEVRYEKGTTYTDVYELTGEMDASYKGIAYDASSYFDDLISQSIVPYDENESRPFNPSYMFGFYGEIQDVGPEIYEQEAMETANRQIFKEFAKQFPDEQIDFPKKAWDRSKAFGTACGRADYAMQPVWFLTWRQKKSVAYAVVNGQTGKTYADVPASLFKVILASLLFAIPIFAALYFGLPTLSIYTTLLAASAIGLWAIFLSQKISAKIVEQEERINQKKALLRQSKMSKSGHVETIDLYLEGQKGKPTKMRFLEWLFNAFSSLLTGTIILFQFILPVLFFIGTAIAFLAGLSRRTLRMMGYLVILVCLFILIRKIFKEKNKAARADLINVSAGAAAAIVLAFVIHLIDPVRDLVYYIAGFFIIAGVLWSLIALVRQYNRMATHPDPHFFADGKEAGR